MSLSNMKLILIFISLFEKVSYPSNLDLTRPESLGLYATRHFHFDYEDGDKTVSIAAWHIVPNHIARRFHKQLQLSPETLKNITNDANYHEDAADENKYKAIEKMLRKTHGGDENDKEIIFEEILRKTKDPIVLYLHGNTGTRANGHRVDLYKTLRRLGYHIIAIDYRGFADSSDISPTETGCVSDAFHMYSYIKNLTNNAVFVYGHSLGRLIGLVVEVNETYVVSCSGTGIGLHMVSNVDKSNIDNPSGVILEAPFNNMKDEIKRHPFSWVGSPSSSLQSVCTLNGLQRVFTSKHSVHDALTETLSVTSIKFRIACLL